MVLVAWVDAMAYCEWAGTRLATEAEWERAARGGLEGKLFPWGDEEISHELANYDNQDGTTPVGKYPPNGYGLCDMVGNAWEWVADYYDAKYYSHSHSARSARTGAGFIARPARRIVDTFCPLLPGRLPVQEQSELPRDPDRISCGSIAMSTPSR